MSAADVTLRDLSVLTGGPLGSPKQVFVLQFLLLAAREKRISLASVCNDEADSTVTPNTAQAFLAWWGYKRWPTATAPDEISTNAEGQGKQTESGVQKTRTTALLKAIDTPYPTVDLDAARQYISALTGSVSTPMAWSAICERQGMARLPSLFLYGPLQDHEAALIEANVQGCQIECIVNQTNGVDRTANDIANVRALWICTDSENARFTREQIDDIWPRPHLVVKPFKGEFDVLWLTQPGECLVTEFAAAMWKLMLRFKSNKGVLHIEQRFRVPGFVSWRDAAKPFQVEIIVDRSRSQPYPGRILHVRTSSAHPARSHARVTVNAPPLKLTDLI